MKHVLRFCLGIFAITTFVVYVLPVLERVIPIAIVPITTVPVCENVSERSLNDTRSIINTSKSVLP